MTREMEPPEHDGMRDDNGNQGGAPTPHGGAHAPHGGAHAPHGGAHAPHGGAADRTSRLGEIDQGLRDLRRLVRSSVFFRGAAIIVAVLAAMVLVSLGVDRLFRLSVPARMALTSLGGLVVGWAAWKRLLRPLFVKLPDELIADRLERRFPELGDTLRSAIDFRRDPRLFDDAHLETLDVDHRLAVEMKREVSLQATERLAAVDRDDIVDTPGLVDTMAKSVAVVAVVAGVFVLFPSALGIWWERNILFGAREWPYATRLIVEGFDAERRLGVPQGDPAEIIIRAEGEDPIQVTVRIQYANEEVRYNLPREGKEALFVYRHPSVTEAFRFTVTGGDFRSPLFEVYPRIRPVVEELEVTARPPEYTGLPPNASRGELGELAAPEGSRLDFAGRANKPLRRAWLTTAGGDVELAVEGASFSGSWTPPAGGGVTVWLEDVEQVPPDQLLQFSVHLIADRAPKVDLAISGLGSMITSYALMPLEIEARDDYKVESLSLSWTVSDAEQAATTGEVDLPGPDVPSDRVSELPEFEVSSLGIEPERRLTVRVGAKDNDGQNGAKIGHSSLRSFLVVTPEKLGDEFLRREQEQRRVLLALLDKEKEVRDATYELISASWKDDGELAEEVVQRMLALARTERQHSRTCESVAGAIEQILTEMRNNRVGEADDLERLAHKIIAPLRTLADDSMPAASVEFGKVRDQTSGADRVAMGVELGERLQRHVALIEEIIEMLSRLESFTEIVKYLRGIIDLQTKSVGAAKVTLEREIDSLIEIEGGTDDSSSTSDK